MNTYFMPWSADLVGEWHDDAGVDAAAQSRLPNHRPTTKSNGVVPLLLLLLCGVSAVGGFVGCSVVVRALSRGSCRGRRSPTQSQRKKER
jgi:hypothetical protein